MGECVAARLGAAVAEHRLVNVTGPPGVGKSRLVAGLADAWLVDLDDGAGMPPEGLPGALAGAGGRLVVVDGVDGRRRTEALGAALDTVPAAGCRLVVVSRGPVAADPAWGGRDIARVPVPPLPDTAVAKLAETWCADPGARKLAVRLACGVPFVAEAVCRAVLAGTPASAPGAVADRVAGELTGRLAREAPGRRWQHALRLLATVGAGDERLLSAGPEVFDVLAGLSVVRRGALGLSVEEPYRQLLELAYRWRSPDAHGTVRTRASGYRVGLLAKAREPEERAGLMEQALFLTGDPVLRGSLFPSARPPAAVERAGPSDAAPIGRLLRQWAARGGFDLRRAERLTEHWQTEAFHIARDGDGRVVGLASLLPMSGCGADGVEPLLQQHADALVDAGRADGLFLGAAFCPDRATHAHLLRHVLRQAVLDGPLVVSTATPEYQSLLGSLGFRRHGSVRDDVYRCGRRPEVYSNDMRPEALPRWLRSITPEDPPARAGTATVRQWIGQALGQLHDTRALARSPLLAHPETATATALRRRLCDAVRNLAMSDDPADAEAGAILRAYYLERGPTHRHVAARLHLSRATYFRRLDRGLTALAGMWERPFPP
ncbi:hypothetical protein [Streptomyces mangrovi]|uniref:hypothetical protein n=1 Tax=Streptomyces mangrovi TaxID=1206892 RepID=UPI00399CFCDB